MVSFRRLARPAAGHCHDQVAHLLGERHTCVGITNSARLVNICPAQAGIRLVRNLDFVTSGLWSNKN
jgi:hypothetical protein